MRTPTSQSPARTGSRPRAAGSIGPQRPKLKRLRLALILAGLGVLALISTVFGMMTAVSSDLPALENEAEYRAARNSLLLGDDKSRQPIAKLTGNNNRILLDEEQIAPTLENAVVAIEDQRFYRHGGVDYKGIARALSQDLLRRRAVQGGSTITQQFVKNALSAQGERSVFQKLRESALAYHLERKWSKEKVLTQYLNSVYFGNGAYGVEAAVRTYFGKTPGPGDPPAARLVEPAEAALLAGMIASPSMYDPVENPDRARARRDQVLERMLEQKMIGRTEYEEARRRALPARSEVRPPRPDSDQPYFSSWLTQQLVDRYRPGVVFGGGLRIETTLDPELQEAAEQSITRKLDGVGPDSSLVAIENKTGEVKAMVGGQDFDKTPFNLATNGHRQPGSAFKPFTLIAALQKGVSPEATFTSKKKVLPGNFEVNNYEDSYAGVSSLRSATSTSDNSVYAELGLQVGTKRIARLARRMGVRTPVSTNPAMTLGGLKQGLTPLELAYSYSTIANRGVRVSGSLAGQAGGPVGVEKVQGSDIEDANKKVRKRVFSPEVAEQTRQLLAGVISDGTGKAASIGEFAAGKTGTTENYGDAWFVGFNDELTVAVWVGYADKLREMKTEYSGGPVAGGTFPAEIWRDVMANWIRIRDGRGDGPKEQEPPPSTVPTTPAPGAPAPAPDAAAPAAPP
ncbi:MAG: transglycosylase domain-containing protein, partial [Actinomycetota bacterium]|nr:transglycosylase domain-containing protein [Actinomycetota bacterium]